MMQSGSKNNAEDEKDGEDNEDKLRQVIEAIAKYSLLRRLEIASNRNEPMILSIIEGLKEKKIARSSILGGMGVSR
jgi:hypothetical protein